jgi:hypothetical protein
MELSDSKDEEPQREEPKQEEGGALGIDTSDIMQSTLGGIGIGAE